MSTRILVIEDNPINLELAQYLLENGGYIVLTATDGELGVSVTRSERPDLIVCDLQMPVMDGFGVARELKRDPQCSAIPLIAVTALSMSGDEQSARAAGFDGYFSKPIDPEKFVTQIEAFLPEPMRMSSRQAG